MLFKTTTECIHERHSVQVTNPHIGGLQPKCLDTSTVNQRMRTTQLEYINNWLVIFNGFKSYISDV